MRVGIRMGNGELVFMHAERAVGVLLRSDTISANPLVDRIGEAAARNGDDRAGIGPFTLNPIGVVERVSLHSLRGVVGANSLVDRIGEAAARNGDDRAGIGPFTLNPIGVVERVSLHSLRGVRRLERTALDGDSAKIPVPLALYNGNGGAVDDGAIAVGLIPPSMATAPRSRYPSRSTTEMAAPSMMGPSPSV